MSYCYDYYHYYLEAVNFWFAEQMLASLDTDFQMWKHSLTVSICMFLLFMKDFRDVSFVCLSRNTHPAKELLFHSARGACGHSWSTHVCQEGITGKVCRPTFSFYSLNPFTAMMSLENNQQKYQIRQISKLLFLPSFLQRHVKGFSSKCIADDELMLNVLRCQLTY